MPSCPFLFPQVIEGKLAPFLGKVIKFATSHVYSCSLCSQKGFICEICNNGEILYPFEDISTSRYRMPLSVYGNVSGYHGCFGQGDTQLPSDSSCDWRTACSYAPVCFQSFLSILSRRGLTELRRDAALLWLSRQQTVLCVQIQSWNGAWRRRLPPSLPELND